MVNHILHPLTLTLVNTLHPMKIVDAEIADGIRRVAVQVNQCLKTVLFTAVKEPVNWAFLIDFGMVLHKIIQEVITDTLSAGGALVT